MTHSMTHATPDAGILYGEATAHAAPSRVLTGSLLIAGRDDDSVCGALRIAELLARRDRVNAHVLALAPALPFTASLLTRVDSTTLEEAKRQEYLARVRHHIHATVGRSAHFSLSAASGSPSQAVARAAEEHDTELIVMGLAPHRTDERAATEDAVLQVARTAPVPVLAVPADCERLPRRALVAMDFSAASTRAARAALLSLAPGGRITLAHVAPDLDFRLVGRDGLGEIYAEGVAALFRRLVPELQARGEVEVESVLLRGNARRALLELATFGDFDLAAVGSQTAPWADAQLTGSVSGALLRGTSCAVMIAPPPEARR